MSQPPLQPGAIVWYRPEAGRGVVRLTSGRQYSFTDVEGLDDPAPNLMCMIRVEGSGRDEKITVVGVPGGAREFLAPPEPKPKKKPVKARAPRGAAAVAPRKAGAKGAGAAKRKTTGKATRLAKKPDGSYPVDMSVSHEQWGQGFVVVCSPKVARVRFMPSGEERSVRVEDLKGLE
jgi:hypothetical protein